jgi:hypothetical protein
METPGDSRNCQTPGVLRQSRRVSFWTKIFGLEDWEVDLWEKVLAHIAL